MLTIGNIRRSCRCLIISMVFKHGVCTVNRILLISYIILFIYSFHYITFRLTIFWSFHNSFLVYCPSSFLFHILFDFYVPSTYCTTTFCLGCAMWLVLMDFFSKITSGTANMNLDDAEYIFYNHLLPWLCYVVSSDGFFLEDYLWHY